MNENEQGLEELDLDAIMREFGADPKYLTRQEEEPAPTQEPEEPSAEEMKPLSAGQEEEEALPEQMPALVTTAQPEEPAEAEEAPVEAEEVPEEIPEQNEEAPEEAGEAPEEEPDEKPEEPSEETSEDTSEEAPAVTQDTIRLDDLSEIAPEEPSAEEGAEDSSVTDETVRLDPIAPEAAEDEETETVEFEGEDDPAESAGEAEEMEAAEVRPPLVFRPKSRLRELKRDLIAGPEKRYYELSEIGVGKLQMAIFLCLIVILVSGGAAAMYTAGLVPENRMRLMVFGQILAMLFGALLGSYQMMQGISDLFHGRFTLNTLLAVTFAACAADSVFCLQELRVPICACFTLEVAMSLWAEYQRRSTEIGMMDTMRKAIRLDSVVKCPDYYDGKPGFLRGEGQVADFMDKYNEVSGPEKVQNTYALLSLLISAGIAVAAGWLHGISMGVQIFSTTLLVAVPASFFVALSRPMAVLERRLHRLGTVLCGWSGIKELSTKGSVPLNDEDIFPNGSVKMNGVKFYGDRDPEKVIAYAAALMNANGGSLAPIFDQLLTSRNGIRYHAVNPRHYGNGGMGGEINEEPVLMGSLDFLKDMGVEIPEGVMVKQAVYVSIDGELSGLFAITYNRMKSAASGIATLNGFRALKMLIVAEDFMLTGPFMKEKFGVNLRRLAFPDRMAQTALKEKTAPAEAPALALTTQEGLAPMAYALTGARALRAAWRLGLFIHIVGGLLGMLIMAALAYLGAASLLSPIHVLLYQLVWMIPGLLVTLWTRVL